MLKWKKDLKTYNQLYNIHSLNSLKHKNNINNSINEMDDNKIPINDEQRSSLKVTYEKTSCYFCNEWLDTQTFKEHIIHCGQVLEKCPQSCEAYIQRKRMRVHLKECPKIMKKDSSTNVETNISNIQHYFNRFEVLEQDIIGLRNVLNEEIKQRLHLITDVGSLRKHKQISDEWTQKVGDVLCNMKKCINEESSLRNNEIERLKDELDKLSFENQDLKQYHMKFSQRLDDVQSILTDEESIRQNFLSLTEDGRNGAFESSALLRNEIDTLQNKVSTVNFQNENNYMHIMDNITKVESQIYQHKSEFWSKIEALNENMNEIRADLQVKFVSNTELNTKQTNLDYEVKSMKNIVCETEEKCEKLEKIVYNIERAIHQTNQVVADLEAHLLYENKMNAIQSTKGHIMWKLTDYSKKLEEARKFDVNIQGPLFTNKPYGYTLRLDVFLNGIGNWRGRNIIASLNVVPGEFDTLLEWPCKLQADIILRDQCYNDENRQDHVRSTVVKRKNDDFHSHQYIHIPHRIVQSHNYVRNDAIIFEIRMQKIK